MDIFRRLAKKYDAFTRNVQFLDDEAKVALEDVSRILNLEEPYSEIRKLRVLEMNIEASVKIALSSQKEKVREKLSSIREEIERALSEGNFLSEFNESVLSPFKEIEKITEKAEDCALVQSQLSMINSCRTDAYERIDHEKQIIRQRPKKAPYGNEPETPAGPGTSPACPKGVPGSEPEAPPSTVTAQKRTTFITEISFFRSEKLIEGEEDVDAYIKNLKAKLMKILEEKNIRV